MERRQRKSLKHLWVKCLSVCAIILFIGFNVIAQDEDSPSPILLTESNSTRALAVTSNEFRGKLPRKSTQIFNPGAESSAVFFVSNLSFLPDEGANALRFYLEDADGKKFRLQVTSVLPVKGRSDIFAITVRLYDANAYNGQPEAKGDVFANLTWRGMVSNAVKLGLGSTGGSLETKGQRNSDSPSTTLEPAKTEKTSDFASNESGKTETSSLSADAPTASRIRFMEQTTFGPNAATDLRLRQIGSRRWTEEQFNKPFPSTAYPDLPLQVTNVPTTCDAICRRDYYTMYQLQNWFYKDALYGDAQLRRRVSWALSEMWVVSGVDTQQSGWELEYIKILDKHAFGNYRDLMRDMTLNPAMGNYLDMVRSTRTNPNENYPREILQLFAVGLDEMKQDGTPKLDSSGNRIPSYDQNTVNQFTKIFTGWTLAPPQTPGVPNYIDPMVLNQNNHDVTAKTLFNYPGAPFPTVPAGQNGSLDLSNALDNIFNHPNVAPFVCTRLIQQMVTSDPTPAYVGRCSAAFNNNGSSVRGDMKAVIRAVLFDPEARGTIKTDPNYGKLREPVQLITNILRQFNALSADRAAQSDGYINPQSSNMAQNVWYSPTVFNFYAPDYVVPGSDINGPEFAILNTGTSFNRINFVNTIVYSRINSNGATGTAPLGTSISLSEPQSISASDVTGNKLIEYLNSKMLHGTMSTSMKNTLRTAITAIAATDSLGRAKQAVYLVASSTQYQVQK